MNHGFNPPGVWQSFGPFSLGIVQADVVLGDIVSYVADKNDVLPSGQEVVED
jgi:hypothetical protein